MFPVGNYGFVIWPDGFTLADDLLLLEGVLHYGLGSWESIKGYMGRPSGEPLELIARHFFAIYGKDDIYLTHNKVYNYDCGI